MMRKVVLKMLGHLRGMRVTAAAIEEQDMLA